MTHFLLAIDWPKRVVLRGQRALLTQFRLHAHIVVDPTLAQTRIVRIVDGAE